MEVLLILLYVAVGVYLIWCFINIAEKAGYSKWFGVLMIIPLVNFIILGILAFETWPISKSIVKQKRRLRELREQEHTTACDECENPVAESDKFCSSCGVEFIKRQNVCPKCNHKVTKKMTYCPECGCKLGD